MKKVSEMKCFELCLGRKEVGKAIISFGLCIYFYYKVRKIECVEVFGNQQYYNYWRRQEI